MEKRLVTNLPDINDGQMKIPTGVGWGTDLNLEVVQNHLWKINEQIGRVNRWYNGLGQSF